METKQWWKDRVVYQIYPRSFCDSNGDGIGDINGIISRLDYLKELGIGIIWLSPLYKSPNDDNGYDISDYCDIHPDFGTIDDFKRLLELAHQRDIKLIMDLVINHTSDEHPWFIQSREEARKRACNNISTDTCINNNACNNTNGNYLDYYYWREGRNGGKLPPNNWTSFFSGSAWQLDDVSGLYYLRLFSKKQPDLNWHNPRVKEEVKKVLRFWLDMGIDGFRCDVINVIYKEMLENKNATNGYLPDGKKRIALTGQEHYLCRPGCYEILKDLKQSVFSNYDCFTVGETVLVTVKTATELCDPKISGLDMVFSFEHMDIDSVNNKWLKIKYKPQKLINVLAKWQTQMSWNTIYLENHDQPRSVSRFGSVKTEDLYKKSAKMLAVLVLTLRGTPFIYEGEEIGMVNGDFTSLNDLRDVESITVNSLMKSLHFPQKLRTKLILRTTRDNARTPVQWDNKLNAGFSTGTPWLAVNSNYKKVNVESELKDISSILNFYKKLINLRKTENDFISASFEHLYSKKGVFAYKRGSFVIILNMNNKYCKVPYFEGELVLSNQENITTEGMSYTGKDGNDKKKIIFSPFEARIIRIKK